MTARIEDDYGEAATRRPWWFAPGLVGVALGALLGVQLLPDGGPPGGTPTATVSATGLTFSWPSPAALPTCPAPTPCSGGEVVPGAPFALPTGSPVVIGDVCSLADRSAVEAIIGTLARQPTKRESDDAFPWSTDVSLPGNIGPGCGYRANDGALDTAFGAHAIGRTEFEISFRSLPGATTVSGVGDVAYAIRGDLPFGAAGAASIVVLDGGTYFTVEARSRTKSSDALLSSITDLAKRIADGL